MVDAATEAPSPSPDIASLTGGVPTSSSSAIADLTKLKKQQLAEESKVIGEQQAGISRDQARVQEAFKAEGVGAADLKPWDAVKEHRKYETDPIQGIGSFGSIFAVIASAFTKTPATNAMLGMAGAINAIRDGNEYDYKLAYDSYKENTKLALERHKLEHEQYQDAISLMQTNMAAGEAKMRNLATKFGDQNTLMLLEHGMNKELFEMMSARDKAATSMMDLNDRVTTHTFQKMAIDEIAKNPPKTGDPVADKMMLAAQIQKVMDPGGRQGSAEQEAVGRYVMAHMKDPPDKFAEGLAELHQGFSAKAPNIQGYQEARQAYVDSHGGSIPAEEDAKLLAQFGLSGRLAAATGAGGILSKPKQEAAEIDRRKAEYIKGGMSEKDAYDKAVREVGMAKAVPSGNKLDELQGKIDQTDNIIRESNANLDFLRQFKGGAGLMGKIMRGEEIAENITGAGTQTERVAFRRRVHELQEMVPRIIVDSNGRPLKAAQDKVDDFVAGLNAGDTGPNTIRAYEDLIKEMQKRQADYRARKTGTSAPAGAAEPAASGSTDWLNAYPEKK